MHNIVFLERNDVTSSRYRFDLNELRYLGRPNAVLRSAVLKVSRYHGEGNPSFFATFTGQRTLDNGKPDNRRQRNERMIGIDLPDGAFLAAFVGSGKCHALAVENLYRTMREWNLTAERMRVRVREVFPDLRDDPYTKFLLSRYEAKEAPQTG